MRMEVLTGEEEARLSFVGATRTMLTPADGTVAVIDVGGGSSEIAIGDPNGAMAWSASFRIGSGFLADAFTSRITLGVLLGYVVGKPVGLAGLAWVVTKASRGRLRPPVGWGSVIGAGTVIRSDVPPNTLINGRQTVSLARWR